MSQIFSTSLAFVAAPISSSSPSNAAWPQTPKPLGQAKNPDVVVREPPSAKNRAAPSLSQIRRRHYLRRVKLRACRGQNQSRGPRQGLKLTRPLFPYPQ